MSSVLNFVVAASVVAVLGRRALKREDVPTDGHATASNVTTSTSNYAQRAEWETQRHARSHQGTDFRATVSGALIVGMLAMVFKDGKVLYSDLMLIVIVGSGILGFLFFVIAAFVSRRNMKVVETPEQIRRRFASMSVEDAALNELSAMQKITRRKSLAANAACITAFVQFVACGAGLFL